MNTFSKIFRKALFITALVLLFIPFIQIKFKIFDTEPLCGAILQPEKLFMNTKDWFSGDYQQKKDKYFNETFGLRSIFIRINNQIAFNFFNKAKANGVIIGKGNCLYEENYIKAYYGTDFIGIDSITHRMQKLKLIQDTLKKLNKDIFIVFAAGKGNYYPENIPESFKTKKGITNYEVHINLAKKLNLNFIDFNRYFMDNKYKSKYPLYPQFGIHWSHYGACLVADSMIRYIEKIRNIDMVNLVWKKINFADHKENDYDIAAGMNLLFELKGKKLAYPELGYESDSGKTKPSILTISDSFYWDFFNFSTPFFSKNHFWFYNKQVFPETYKSPIDASSLNLKEQIAMHDVFLIMGTDATLPNFGWGFIENVYAMFYPNSTNK